MSNNRPLNVKLLNPTAILFAISIVISQSTYAEKVFLSYTEAKAHYSIEVAKQIEWPDESTIKQFTVSVVGNESQFIDAFLQPIQTTIRGKKVTLVPFNDEISTSDEYSLIFIPKNKRSQNKKIFNHFKHSLIIVDGRVNTDEQMVSLISDRDQVEIRLNRDNLAARGFSVSISLLEMVGTKEDLGDQLRDWESDLKEMTQQVHAKEDELANLSQTLSRKSSALSKAQKELEKNEKIVKDYQQQLQKLTEQIASSQDEVGKNAQYIAEQSAMIAQKQQELAENEKSFFRLQKNIQESKSILEKQVNQITQQSNTIASREKTIDIQRNWIIAILLVASVFFIMIYILLKINNLRRKANKELQNLNAQLYELATTDDLSKLSNRRYFLEAAQIELLRQQRHDFHSVLLMIDIDHFKNVNDIYGHAMGDEALRSVAKILKESMRKYDLVGRLGGEEFAMMLVDCDISQAHEIAIRLCERVAENNIFCEGTTIQVTVSVGLSQLAADDIKIEQALMRADKALYDAKNQGRNRVMLFESQ